MTRLLLSFALAAFAAPAPADDAVKPFDGKTLAGWTPKGDKAKSKWRVGTATADEAGKLLFKEGEGEGELVNTAGGGVDLATDAKFGDVTVELEFMVPKGSNSGVYLMGEYEVQVLDSFGKPDAKLTQGDVGAIYSAAAPKVNASKKPGEWQKFVIVFEAPHFEGDKKVKNGKFVKVELNGTVLHENVEVKGPTGGGLTNKEKAEGPLMLQGDHGPVAFRNVVVTPKK